METRQTLRIPLRRSVSVELRGASGPSLGGAPARSSLAGTSSNFSRAGIALEFPTMSNVPVGSTVRITVKISGRDLALPGHVVWSTSQDDGVRAGVKLHPELADSNTRRLFDAFVQDAERGHLARAGEAKS